MHFCLGVEKNNSMGESASVAQMQNQQNRDQQYGVQSQQALSIDSATYKTDSTGMYDHVQYIFLNSTHSYK